MSDSPVIRRVLQVHTRYRQAGGEDRAVEAERRLLEAADIDVRQVIFDNANLQDARGVTGDVRMAASAVWSRSAARRVTDSIREARPDVVHVHNTFAAASPSVFRAASALGIPVVQTLHNYRMVCPTATLFRDGRPCTDCVGRAIPFPAVAHACVRGSRAQSLVAATTLGVHRAMGTFSRHIDRFIALTEFQRSLLVDGGLPRDRIDVVPNFLEPDPGPGHGLRQGLLFVGRLSPEKGITTLLAAAAQIPGVVRIAGDGPMLQLVAKAAARGEVEYLGRLDPDAIVRELQRALALVVPSTWFEGFPMVVLEAYATGTPVIASGLGSLAEVVEDGVTGVHLRPGDAEDLSARIAWAEANSLDLGGMGGAARRRYEGRFRGRAHLGTLLGTYESAGQFTRH